MNRWQSSTLNVICISTLIHCCGTQVQHIDKNCCDIHIYHQSNVRQGFWRSLTLTIEFNQPQLFNCN